MKTIYVNAIGNYTKLTQEDLIQNIPAYQWLNEASPDDDNLLEDLLFVNVSIGDTGYKVHHSQVQIVTTKNIK